MEEKEWKEKDIKFEKRDATVSAILMFVLSIAVMACAAGTLYPAGLKIDNAIDMVKLMEPIAGRFAISIFVGGIVCAGLSSFFPIVLLAPWLFSDYNNKPRNMKSTPARILVFIGCLFGLFIPFFGGRPVFIMILSQSLAIIVTPIVLLLFMILRNNKRIMGEDKLPSLKWNIYMGIILLFTIVLAICGIIGISGSV